MADAAACDHEWRAYSEAELAELRRAARRDRPPMAWIEGAEQCAACGRVEAAVSWFGQAHRVLVAPKETGGAPSVHWPSGASVPNAAMGES